MTQVTVDQALQIGLRHHQAGQLQQAESIYRQILQLVPNQPDALHLLGALVLQSGRPGDAIELIDRAIASHPAPEFSNTLSRAWIDRGIEFASAKQIDSAIDAFQSAVRVQPRSGGAHSNLANALLEKGDTGAAIDAANTAISLEPQNPFAHNNLGAALMKNRSPELAVNSFNKAVSLDPNFADAWFNLGAASREVWQLSSAIAAFEKSIALNPERADAHESLGEALKENGQLDAAVAELRKAVEMNPGFSRPLNHLANVHSDQGRLDEALKCYKQIAIIDPADVTAANNFVYIIHFHPDYDARRILEENLKWAKRFEAPLAGEMRPHNNNRDPDRRLKIGYVSPDFRTHAAACFLLPLLANQNPGSVEIFCYASIKRPDAITAKMRELSHNWRDCFGLSDAQVVDMIRQDGIDILVDLTLHMADNRLLVFARKPAPVAVTWLGYPSTTGMKSIDYRLSDPHLDPPGQGDEMYREKTFRLPKTFWCYQPLIENTPDVNELPSLKHGFLTFGCFNNFAKVTPPTIQLWKQVLNAVPNSRLIIQCHPGQHRDAVTAILPVDRIEFVTPMPPLDYFHLYHRVDVCLDPIPCPGHTSTLDALWMGVPTVTLAGNTAISRGGASILTNVGLPEFIAHSNEQYIQIAANIPRLSSLRANLHTMLKSSPLMDAKQFAADLENAYRQIWRDKGGSS